MMRLPESVLLRGSWAGVTLAQLTLVAVVGALAWLLARRGGPALRAAVLLATLVGLLVVPVVASVAPVWVALPEWACLSGGEAPGDSQDTHPAAPPTPPEDHAIFALLVSPPAEPEMVDPENMPKQAGDNPPTVKAEAVVLDLAPPVEEIQALPRPRAPHRPSWTLPGLLAALWLAGAVVCLLRTLVRLGLLYRRAWRARTIRTRAWTECVEALASRYGLPAVALRESRDIASPLTMGLFRPVILLPRGRRSWSAEQRALILGHELAHVRRRDFLAGLLAELALCLCWFHPLVRWLSSRLRLEQEYAADASVASAAADSSHYVRCLARLALELDRGPGLLAPTFWRRRAEIMRRIDMLRRNPKGLPARLGTRAGWTVALLAAAACLAVGGVGPVHSAGESPKKAGNVPEANGKATTDQRGDPLPAGAQARLGTTRLRHGDEVTFVAFGPGGKTLLTAGRDNAIHLWDLTSGKDVRRFALPKPIPVKPPAGKGKQKPDQTTVVQMMMAGGGNDGGIVRLAVTTDGKTLAVNRGNAIQLYDVETGAAVRLIQSQSSGLQGLLFSPDGKILAGRGPQHSFFLWATDTGKELQHIKSPARPRNDNLVFFLGGGGDPNTPGMAFTPDGKALAVATAEYNKQGAATQFVKLYEVTSGKEMQRIKTADNAGIVAIAPDGATLAYGLGNTLHLCSVKTGKELRQIKPAGGRIVAAAFTPDSKRVAIRGRSQRLGLWDTETGKEIHSLSDAQPVQRGGGGGFVLVTPGFSAPEMRALAISADGKQVAAAAGSTVRLWDARTGKERILSDGHRKSPRMMILSRDGKTLISWGGDRVVRRWEAATGRLLGSFPAPARTTRAALDPDGRSVALANADGTIRIHDAITGKERHQLKGPANGIAALAFAPDGKVLAARSSADSSIQLYDAAAGRELRRIVLRPGRDAGPGPGQVIIFGGGGRRNNGPGLAFSPDGKLLAAPGRGGRNNGNTLVLCDVAAGKELRKIELPQPVTSLVFAPDGRTLATENADRTITLWEVASGKKQGQLGKAPANARPRGRGTNVAFVVNGMGGGGSQEPAGPVGLAYSPDGRALAARGVDLSVRVWDVMAGKEISRLKGHEGRIETVAFAPDGKTLASGATDTTILVWDARNPLKELAKPQKVELTDTDRKALWGDLAGVDALRAHQGVLRLSAARGQTVKYLRERLKPAVRVDPGKIDGWIRDLESEKYAVRKAANDNLVKVGEQSVPALRKVLAGSPPLETRKRAEELVEKLTGGTLTTEQLRLVRAVETLERIGTPEARLLLRTLAQGAPGTLPTREAEAALKRLGGVPARR